MDSKFRKDHVKSLTRGIATWQLQQSSTNTHHWHALPYLLANYCLPPRQPGPVIQSQYLYSSNNMDLYFRWTYIVSPKKYLLVLTQIINHVDIPPSTASESPVWCWLDFLCRGKDTNNKRSRKRMEQWILNQEKKRLQAFASEMEELDEEADRLADRQKRVYNIFDISNNVN